MANTLSRKTLKTRRPHDCFGCAREFPAGTIMLREGVKDGGIVFTAYLCESCQAVMSNFNFGDEFGFGELLDDALDYESAQREEGDG